MASLGKFGVAHDVAEPIEPDTFEWFGENIRVTSVEINQIELIDLMETVQNVDEDDIRALTIVKDLFRMVLHVDDFARFWETAKKNRQEIKDLMPVFQLLLAELSDRPTPRQSDSSPGLPGTSESSPVVSSLLVRAGRPDLQILRDDSEADKARVISAALAG